VFLTHVQDLVPQVPYRRYLAPWGSGKSAALDAVGNISYRGIILAGSDTEKSIVRKLHNWRGTAIIDEADFSRSTYHAFIVKILNLGYDRRTGYYSRCDEDDPFKTVTYRVYGCKLLATRSRFSDTALESRCLSSTSRQNINPVPLFRMSRFLREASELRNKLLLWRFRNYHRIKTEAEKLEDPNIIDRVYDGGGDISSRVKQVILPLWLISEEPIRRRLTNIAKFFDERLKIEDPDYLLRLQAQDAVKEIINEGEGGQRVNVVNVVNVLIEDPPKKSTLMRWL